MENTLMWIIYQDYISIILIKIETDGKDDPYRCLQIQILLLYE